MSRNSSTSGNELPSFLTPASGSYPQTTVDEPVFRSAQPFESSDAKSLGGLDMVGLSRAAPSSIPSFSSASGIFSPTIGHSKPVYRDLRLTDSMGKSVAPGAFRSASGPSVCPQPMPVIYEANMSFECSRPVGEIWQAMRLALAAHPDISAAPERGCFYGHCEVEGRIVSMHVNLFEKPEGGYLVEFQRRTGDCCAFWSVLRQAMTSLSKDFAGAAAFVQRLGPQKRQGMGMTLPSPTRCTFSKSTTASLCQLASSSSIESQIEALTGLISAMDQGAPCCDKTRALLKKCCESKEERVAYAARAAAAAVARNSQSGSVSTEAIIKSVARNAFKSIQRSSNIVTSEYSFSDFPSSGRGAAN